LVSKGSIINVIDTISSDFPSSRIFFIDSEFKFLVIVCFFNY